MISNIEMQHWYVVQTKPRQEATAKENLERQGYTVYCPQIRQAKRRKRQWKSVIEPLFPRYLFIKLAEGIDNFSPIRSTIGVINLLRFGELPAKVPYNVIASLQLHESTQLQHDDSTVNWKAGEKVEILDGAFAGIKGIFNGHLGEDRVIVLLDILGRNNRFEIEKHNIAPA